MKTNNPGKFFLGSLAIFVLVAAVIFFLLNTMLSLAESTMTPAKMDDEAISERINPVAEERVGEEPIVQASTESGDDIADSADAGPGQQIYTAVCATCHASGLLQSPKLGSQDDWAPRIDKGMDTLYDHAINGFKNMPARGGRQDLSDEDVKAAVDYMVSEAE